MLRITHYFGIFLFSLLSISCGNQNDSEATAENSQPEDTTEMAKYVITPFAPSTSFEDATINSMNYADGTFDFSIGGESYQLGVQTPDAPQKMCANSAEGQHIHLIVDNEPYAAKYTSNFSYEISDGSHYILAFLSRSYHESIKTDNAHVAVKADIKNNAIMHRENITGPMLFYSRPKGNYVGDDTKKIMLDFYLVNATLGNDYNVKADINGEEHIIDTWQPYYIEGLPMGENTITLSLVDKDGQLVEAPLNPVSRTFTLVQDPAENQ